MAGEPVQGRHEAMKNLLLWEGRLKRSRLMSLFGLKKTRASQWINEFGEAYPDWTEWNDQTSAHHATPGAYRDSKTSTPKHNQLCSPIDSYLSVTDSVANVTLERDDGIIWSAFPDFSPPQPEIFSLLYRAIAEGEQVEAIYQSLANPAPHSRTLSPHSIIRAGRRWHTRAFCEETGDFRDFTLGRFCALRPSKRTREKQSQDDIAWVTQVKIEFIPHPGLSEPQQHVIRKEYFSGFASRIESCRGCLVSYLIKDLRATLNPERDLAPDWLLAVANPMEVSPWLIP